MSKTPESSKATVAIARVRSRGEARAQDLALRLAAWGEVVAVIGNKGSKCRARREARRAAGRVLFCIDVFVMPDDARFGMRIAASSYVHRRQKVAARDAAVTLR